LIEQPASRVFFSILLETGQFGIPQRIQDARETTVYLYRKNPRNSTKKREEKAIDTGLSTMLSYRPNWFLTNIPTRIPP